MNRICTACSQTKPLSEFWKERNGLFGRQSRCKDCRGKYLKERDSQLRVRLLRRVSKYRWMRNNKDKVKAHGKVRMALKTGALVKGQCEKCGAIDVHAHHSDYTKPLNVKWLCAPCHKK